MQTHPIRSNTPFHKLSEDKAYTDIVSNSLLAMWADFLFISKDACEFWSNIHSLASKHTFENLYISRNLVNFNELNSELKSALKSSMFLVSSRSTVSVCFFFFRCFFFLTFSISPVAFSNHVLISSNHVLYNVLINNSSTNHNSNVYSLLKTIKSAYVKNQCVFFRRNSQDLTQYSFTAAHKEQFKSVVFIQIPHI